MATEGVLLRILRTARHIIAHPKAFSPQAPATNAHFQPAWLEAPEAQRFSLYGAIARAAIATDLRAHTAAARHAVIAEVDPKQADPIMQVATLNRAGRTHARAIALLDRAIESTRVKAQTLFEQRR